MSLARLSGMQRLLEAGVIVTCTVAVFLLMALLSFHPADPGWSQAGISNTVHNLMGSSGAWLADILLFLFGWLAFSIPFVLFICAWWLFSHLLYIERVDYLSLGLKLVGCCFLLLGFTGLASMNFNDFFTMSAGGVIGDIISAGLVDYFGFVGATLILLAFFSVGFTWLTAISWLDIIDNLGALIVNGSHRVARLPKQLPRLGLNQGGKGNHRAEQAQWANDQTGSSATSVSKQDDNTDSQEVDKGYKTDHSNSGASSIEITSVRAEPEPDPTQRYDADIKIPQQIFDPAPRPSSDEASSGTSSGVKNSIVEPAEPAHEPLIGSTSTVGLPSFDLLERAGDKSHPISQEELDSAARLVEIKLLDFGVEAKVTDVLPGPVITRFELELAAGVKVSKITALSKDLARALLATAVRVVEVIPGKSVIGIELPNKNREIVRLSEVLSCEDFQKSSSHLTMVLGADISGEPVVVDLGKMPHLLVAGTTGSGKSVGVNVMILSLLYKSTPDEVRMIMIDPKMLELSVYEGIPHLLTEVVTDMKQASNALRWCVGEMERRYRLMSALGVRNLKGFNQKIRDARAAGQPVVDPLWNPAESMDSSAPELDTLPSIVVVVDEFADMIMIVGKKVEELIARIAQKARAAGIHLILATQRPSVDVITGLIKANIPTRIAFQVSSKVDSRTILDQQGAESLLGMGDMLYQPPGTSITTRVHGAFVDDHEVHAVVADWKKRGSPQYIDEILDGDAAETVLLPGEQPEGGDQELDALYDEVVASVLESRKVSVSSVQRRFRIGYNRAARLVEQMEQSGVVTPAGHNGNREVIAPAPPRFE